MHYRYNQRSTIDKYLRSKSSSHYTCFGKFHTFFYGIKQLHLYTFLKLWSKLFQIEKHFAPRYHTGYVEHCIQCAIYLNLFQFANIKTHNNYIAMSPICYRLFKPGYGNRLSLVPSGSMYVSTWTDWLNKTNKQIIIEVLWMKMVPWFN